MWGRDTRYSPPRDEDRGVTRANAAVVRTGDGGRVRLRNNSGSVHLIADLAGWFQPAA